MITAGGNRKLMKQDLYQLLLVVCIIFLIGFLSGFFHFRLDLTAENRYTLSKPTKDILSNLDDIAFVKVYLEGDLPIGFRRLRNSVKEMLDEFRVYGGTRIQYQFINPSESEDSETRNRFYASLHDQGMIPTNVEVRDKKGGMSQQIIFPWAMITYRDYEMPVRLLKNNPGKTAEENLNNSLEALEFELISTLHNLTVEEYERIAFLEGHGELDEFLVGDVTKELLKYYEVFRGTIDPESPGSLNELSLLIIAKPEKPFTEVEKAVLDQYIMQGGKVLWLIDPVAIDLDSLTHASSAVALIKNLNLDDMLFRYGVRVNPNLVMDMQCAFIPVNTALEGQTPRFTPAPWYYSPLLLPPADHMITRNLGMVKAEFTSVIDTVGENPDVWKQVLLSSSRHSRFVNTPAFITLETAKRPTNASFFPMSYLPVAVLLQGEFESVFKNRPIPLINTTDIQFRDKSVPTKMIVIGDGDIIRNDVSINRGVPEALPLGYDRYSRQTFANKEFIMNSINYLLDEKGLMELRNRQLTLRLLDREKVRNDKMKWQLINILLPVFLVSLFGFVFTWYRKFRFSR